MTTQTPTAPPASRGRSTRALIQRHFGEVAISAVFVILFVLFSVFADHFLSADNLINVLRQVAPTVIVAMAMTFVITSGAIDLSVGSTVGLVAASLGLLANGIDPLLALAIALGIGAAIGAINGSLVAYGNMPPFIVTLATLTGVRGLALLITQGYSTPITSPLLIPLGQGSLAGIYTPTWIALLIVALMWYQFHHTRLGRYTIGLGSHAEALRRSGVNTKRIQLIVFTLSGLFAGIAGVLIATRLASGSSNSGTGFEMEVITAVVLGGTSLMGGRGSIIGAVIGALTMGMIANGLVLLHVDVYWVPIAQSLILVIAIFVNSKFFAQAVGSRS